jgi:hypothetical protein
MSPRHGYPQCMSYMNIHKHTWTLLGCRPKSTCKVDGLLPSRHLASPCVSNHVGDTTIERLDQKEKSHPDSLLISIRNIYIWVRDNPLILHLNIQKYYYRIPPTLFILCFQFWEMSIANWSLISQFSSGLSFHVDRGCNPEAKKSIHSAIFSSASGLKLPLAEWRWHCYLPKIDAQLYSHVL